MSKQTAVALLSQIFHMKRPCVITFRIVSFDPHTVVWTLLLLPELYFFYNIYYLMKNNTAQIYLKLFHPNSCQENFFALPPGSENLLVQVLYAVMRQVHYSSCLNCFILVYIPYLSLSIYFPGYL